MRFALVAALVLPTAAFGQAVSAGNAPVPAPYSGLSNKNDATNSTDISYTVGTSSIPISPPGVYRGITIQTNALPICFTWNAHETLTVPTASGCAAGFYLAAFGSYTLNIAIPNSQLLIISTGTDVVTVLSMI